MMRARKPMVRGVVTLGVMMGGLLFGAVPALAAFPEAPQTEAPSALAATTATFKGELNPGGASEEVKYHFAYSPVTEPAVECSWSGKTAPESSLPATGEVSVETSVTGLEASTEYVVCLVAANPAEEGESTIGIPVRFTTPASKPVLAYGAPTVITPYAASFEGKVNPENQATHYHFEYAENEAMTVGRVVVGEGTITSEVSEEHTVNPAETGPVLIPNTPYYYRLVANNVSGTQDGPVVQFETASLQKPEVTGEEASGVSQTQATLLAQINPEYQLTECHMRYWVEEGTDPELTATEVPCYPPSFGGNTSGGPEPVSESLSGLEANTTYGWRTVAKNETGVELGAPGTFTTLPEPPLATTEGATDVTTGSATVAGTVDPNNVGKDTAEQEQDQTSYYFQYGHSTSYGRQLPLTPTVAGEGMSPVAVSANLTELEPGASYDYRIVAVNGPTGDRQSAYGENHEFTTTATPPLLTGVSVQGVTQTTATISATLEAQGLPTRYELQLGATPGALRTAASGVTSTTIPLSLTVGSLTPGTTYYYKLLAVNPNNPIDPATNQPEPTETPEASFATAAAPAGAAAGGLPAVIPYQSIAELNAKEALEDKKLPNPIITKTLTKAEKLKKALKACKKKKGSARTKCEKQAKKKYPTAKKKAKKK